MNDTMNDLLAQGLKVAEDAAYKRGYEKAREDVFPTAPTTLHYALAHLIDKYGDQTIDLDRRVVRDRSSGVPLIVVEDMGLLPNGITHRLRIRKG